MSIFHIPAFTDNFIWVLKKDNDITLIDPGDALPVLELINRNKLTIRDILLTHHHYDHVGGTLELKKHIKGKVYGPKGDIEGVDEEVTENCCVQTLDDNYSFSVLETPGHTLDHISYWDSNKEIIFCGDTLFSAGCGRLFEGTPEQMFNSIQKINSLHSNTLIYCAHEYTKSNLEFVCSQVNDQFIQDYATQLKVKLDDGGISVPTSLLLERKINPFLLEITPSGLDDLSPLEKFTELRTRKDNF